MKFDSPSLERLLIALVDLRDERGLKVQVSARDVFTDAVLDQLPETFRGRPRESSSELVRRMIETPGVYVVSTASFPSALVVVWSQGGVLRAMSIDQVLSPDGFADDLVMKAGPITP